MRASAVQEVVYHCVKVAAPEDPVRVKREHLLILEQQLSSMFAEHAEKDKKTSELSDPFALTTTLLEQVETRAIDVSKRADLLEDSDEEKLRELTNLQVRHPVGGRSRETR